MMKIDAKVNNIPSLTWNWLRINNADLKVEDNFKLCSKVAISKLPSGVTFTENNLPYISKIRNIDSGMGPAISKYFSDNCIEPSTVVVDSNTKVEKPVIFDFELKNNTANNNHIVIDVKENSALTVIYLFESDKKACGINTVLTKLYARKNAKLHFITVQLAGKEFINCDDIGAFCEENGRIEITQIILGGKKSYTGTLCLLNEYQSSFKSDLAYLCKDEQELDMNFVVNHTGRKTDCLMNVKGTLKDSAKKTYRGTIDFKKGCAGATGNEMEDVFLLSPSVTNKSIPVILCDEEDVAGEHGATIGKLDKNISFYMNSRGISTKDAEKIIAQAKIKHVADLIPDEKIRQKITDFTEECFD
ncbi:MAG: SufD family Fe-S cluster assembly protein [Treponema sp.]|nr:SufD family Fe-S cluster assembly protein [Treponema sp.]